VIVPKVQMLKFGLSNTGLVYAEPDLQVPNYRIDEQIKSGGHGLYFDCFAAAIRKEEVKSWQLLLRLITPVKQWRC
jgi:hypothetical protein